MPATEPEQLHRLFEHAFNVAGLEGLLAPTEPCLGRRGNHRLKPSPRGRLCSGSTLQSRKGSP